MDSLISVISELREINSIIGRGKIELPQIVTVGSQSSGKSSVLESIVGWDFLPRGNGIVTRRPLVLNLVTVREDDPRRKQLQMDGDWATFLHMSGQIFTDFEKVRKEIEKDTIKVAGDNKDISETPINLTIYSEKVIDLSLVDLPGSIRLTLPNQSATIKQDIEKIIDHYLKSPKSLILAVTPANADISTSDALYYAKKYDPEGKRTLCVLTKIDIMDRGTDAYEMLTGKTIPVKLGIIGVLNRSQEEINNNKSIEECQGNEEMFFRTNYPSIAAKNGRKYLTTQLNKLLINHIAENLPGLRDAIDNMTIEQRTILDDLGDAPPEDESSKQTTNKVIRNFTELFKNLLDGNQDNIETDKIVGGAMINMAFREFGSFKEIKPDDGLTQEVVINAMRNAHGTRVPMFIPEHCFIQLSKRQIRRLKDPSIAFVDTIKNLLLEIVDYCTSKIIENEKNRFPRLYKRINKVACDTVNLRLSPTKTFVEKIVDMQINYINIRHPEFDFDRLLNEANNQTLWASPTSLPENSPPENNSRSRTSTAASAPPAQPLSFVFENGKDSDIEDFLPPPPPRRGGGNNWEEVKKDKPISTPPLQQQQQKQPNHLYAPDQIELDQCKKLQSYVIQYYKIVCNSLQYMLPKAIMMELVNHIKDNLSEELEKHISALDNVVKELTRESEAITEKRKQTLLKIEELEKAKALLQNITEVDF